MPSIAVSRPGSSARFVLAALLALLALFLGGCARGGEGERARLHLLLITIDTLRADRLSCYGYPQPVSPAIDRLAAEGCQFATVVAHRGQTWPSLTSILTGQYPATHGVRTNGQKISPDHPGLGLALRGAGYRTAGFLTNMIEANHPGLDSVVVCRRFGAPQWEWDEAAITSARDWIAAAAEGEAPWFAWVHLIDPHMPYAPEAPLDTLFRRGVAPGPPARMSEFARIALGSDPVDADRLRHFTGLYDGQVRGVDTRVGRMLAAIDSLGLRERTLVVLTTDHGEELFERNRYFGHSCSIYGQTLRMPLIVAGPGVPARIVSDPIESVDILPTVLDLLGVPAPADVQGRSRAGTIGGESREGEFETIVEWAEEELGGERIFFGLQNARWKYVSNPREFRVDNDLFTDRPGPGYAVGAEELYDLTSDPGELRNVAAGNPEVCARLRARLAERVAAASRAAAGAASDSLDPATAEALRALGYVK